MKLKHWIKQYRREQYRERGRREFADAIRRIFKPRFERMIEAFNSYDKGGLACNPNIKKNGSQDSLCAKNDTQN